MNHQGNTTTTASLRERWLAMNSYRKRDADDDLLQHLQYQQQQPPHQHQPHHQRRASPPSQTQQQPQQQQRHWDLRPFGVDWEDQESLTEDVSQPQLLRSWQTSDDWLPQPSPSPPPLPNNPHPRSLATDFLFPLSPRQHQLQKPQQKNQQQQQHQQQQQGASIHRSQRIAELAAMLTKDNRESYSSVRMKSMSCPQPVNLFDANNDKVATPLPSSDNPNQHFIQDRDQGGDNVKIVSSPTIITPTAAPRTKTKKKSIIEQPQQHRKILQLAPMHSRQPLPPPPQHQHPPPPPQREQVTKPIRQPAPFTTRPKALRSPPRTKKPSNFSYPAYSSDNEGRKLDIYQRSMLRLQERERRLEQRRKELEQQNCTFVPKLAISTSSPTSPLNTTLAATTSVTPPNTTVMATTPTTTTTTDSSNSTSTTKTLASKAAVTLASKESVFERLYRQPTKQQQQQQQQQQTTRPVVVRNDPPKVAAAKVTSWSNRPGTDGNNSWVSSSMSSKIDYLDGLARRNTRTTGTGSDSEAKLLRRRQLEEREMAECTFHPNLNWGKKPSAVKAGQARVQSKTQHQSSPLSDGDESKDTLTRQSWISAQPQRRRQPPQPVKRLPREIVTTIAPANKPQRATMESSQFVRTHSAVPVSPLRDPPVTVARKQTSKTYGLGVPHHPPVTSPRLEIPITFDQARVVEPNKREGHTSVMSPLRDYPMQLKQNKLEESRKVVGNHHPPVVGRLRGTAMTLEGKNVAKSSQMHADIRRHPQVMSPHRDPPSTLKQITLEKSSDKIGVHHDSRMASPHKDPPLTLERKTLAALRDRVEGHHSYAISARRGPSISHERNKFAELSTTGTGSSNHYQHTVHPLRAFIMTTEQPNVMELGRRDLNSNYPLRGVPLTMARTRGIEARKIDDAAGNFQVPPVSPLRDSPSKILERPKGRPAPPPAARGIVLDDNDDEDDTILPPVLPRRMVPISFRPVMDVPRVIYSESLATESVVSGRTVDTEYGSI